MPKAPERTVTGFVERFVEALGFAPAHDLSAAAGMVGGADYCVRLDGRPVLFIGTKSVSRESVYRLRRYGWSAKVPLSVLLTAEELAVVDCRARPSLRAEVSESLVFRCSAEELDRRANEIRALLSRDSVVRGCLDALPASVQRIQEVDDAFLNDIERHRQRLGHDIALQVIDRLVFSRFREDRGIDSYRHLVDSIDNAEERDIAQSFYYPDCPFEFSVMSTDVLGLMHERLLATEKSHARKTGGVYYTPDHVVRYIVASTIGPLLEGRTPEDVSAIRVLDPACGSGSFLLGAFQQIVEWHRVWYLQHEPERHAQGRTPTLFLDRRGSWQITSAKRREILRNSIYGVDLDSRAALVTRLALGLETAAGDGHEALPDLDANIRCGNSLVGSTFDYPQSFPHVFAAGGFDAVIGNPPYLSYGGRQSVDLPKTERDYFARHYECTGWSTAHSLFMERSAKDLSRRLVSFIVPDQVGHLEGYRSLRALMAREGGLVEVKYWGEGVFKEAVTPSLTFLVDKEQRCTETRIVDHDGTMELGRIERGDPWSFSSSRGLLEKLREKSMSIRPYLADCGVRTTNAKRQVVKVAEATGKFVVTLEGKQIGRYWCAPPEVAVRLDTGANVFLGRDHKYENAKFLIRQTAAYPIAGPREHATHFRNSLHALYAPDGDIDVRYLVGLLNSKLLRFAYVATIREASQRVFPQVKLGPLGTLPIRALDLKSPNDRKKHDRVVELVDAMLKAQRQLRGEKNEVAAEARRLRVRELDADIDRTVFELYGLTATEVAEVETVIETLAPAP